MMDLPKAVRYKSRKKKGKDERDIPREALVKRTYNDFEKLSEQEKMSTVEVDCVVGRLGLDK